MRYRIAMSLQLAVLISGSGRTMQNIAEAIARGELDATIKLVVASNDTAAAKGIERAHALKLPTMVVPRKSYASVADFSQHLFGLVRDAGCNPSKAGTGAESGRDSGGGGGGPSGGLVALAGWLSLLDIPDDFAHRVVNIHPALLPAFGGQGMWGHHVHEAVLAAGCKVTGCTVHYCDQTYDTGPIIAQRTCPVLEDDTPDTLAARVFEEECIAYPQALQWIAQDRVKIDGRRTRITPS
jgi:phosphoribosylglycinamide formyltransferase-1